MPKNIECEMRGLSGLLERVSVAQALGRPGEVMKCFACGGRLWPHNESSAAAAHFEHAEKHTGCPLGSDFTGPPSPHPNQAEL